MPGCSKVIHENQMSLVVAGGQDSTGNKLRSVEIIAIDIENRSTPLTWTVLGTVQQGLEMRGFWSQKKTVQLKTALREVYTYVLNGFFFQKLCICKAFGQNPCISRLLLCSTVYSVKVHTSQLRLTTKVQH